MGRKSELSASQRQQVVLMMLRRDEPLTVLARRYGVFETTLHRWRDGFLTAGQAALAYGRSRGLPGCGLAAIASAPPS